MTRHRTLRALARRLPGLAGSVTATTGAGVVMTFDDGPDPRETDRVLDALGRQGATATFFVLLSRTRRHPEILRRVLSEGHEVALHGPDHRALTTFGYAEVARRTREARDELQHVTGATVRWFRPPYGHQSPATWVAVRRCGLVPVLWSGTTWDWKDVDPVERRAKAAAGIRPGAIILAHDGIAGLADGAATDHVALAERAELAELVLADCAARGLAVSSLGRALRKASPVRTTTFTTLRRSGQG